MQESDWHEWCRGVVKSLTNIEKTLNQYNRLQKRMLYMILIGFMAVLGNGVLLFYK